MTAVLYGLRDPDGRHWHAPTGYPYQPRLGWVTVVGVLVPGGLFEWREVGS